MIPVVGVRFKRAGKIYFFSPGDFSDLGLGENVIVETSRGLELGEVAEQAKQVPEEEVIQPLKQVIRLASQGDIDQAEINYKDEQEAFSIAVEKIEKHGLEMKLVDVEYTFDRNKLVFYFTADQRVDFRELVKDLAARFRTRIELRQIGVRDEAKMLGGLGVCGRRLCCSAWMSEFAPVSIRQAKDQDLAMNPNKISGLCGRLKCCLRFEAEAYEEARTQLPRIGQRVSTPIGDGRVVAVNLLSKRVTVQCDEGPRVEMLDGQVLGAGKAAQAASEGLQEQGCASCAGCHEHSQQETEKGQPEQAPEKPKKPRRRPRPNPQMGGGKASDASTQAAEEIAASSEENDQASRRKRKPRRRKVRKNRPDSKKGADNPVS